MIKVCFNEKNEIIGFNLKDAIYFINLFNINVNKNITERVFVQKKDSFNRKLYKITKNNKEYITTNNKVEDAMVEEYSEYIEKIKSVSLLKNPELFTLEDIKNEKINQLKFRNDNAECILIEFMDDNNCFNNSGKNVLIINGENISNKITLSEHSQLKIYYESDNSIDVFFGKTLKSISTTPLNDDFQYHTDQSIIIKISGNANINCLAILLK